MNKPLLTQELQVAPMDHRERDLMEEWFALPGKVQEADLETLEVESLIAAKLAVVSAR